MSYLHGSQRMFHQLLVGFVQAPEKSRIRLTPQGDQLIYSQPSRLCTVCQYDSYSF